MSKRTLYQIEWSRVVDYITRLEPQEGNIDFLILDKTLELFCAITHEVLKTIYVDTVISSNCISLFVLDRQSSVIGGCLFCIYSTKYF